jgi:TRAP-type uncharacterized transport system substrate-binding protein
MASDPDTGVSLRRRKRRISALLVLAAGLLLFVGAAGGLYLALQPVTLKIAVGPQGSDDLKLIQALAQTFAHDKSSVRLAPIQTPGAAESIALLAAGKTDLAVARGDLAMPADAESVAILRKNVVALWAPSGLPVKGKKPPAAKIKSIDDLAGHRVGVIGRTQANVTLLRVILKESGVDPDKVSVTQFGTGQIAEMARDPAIDAFMAVGPLDSKITADAIAATATAKGEPKFLPIDVSEAIAQKHPLYESEEIAGSTFSSSPARPEDKIDTVSVENRCRKPRSAPSCGNCLPCARCSREKCLAPRKSKNRIPTRTPHFPRIRALRRSSTAPNARSWRNTATTSGPPFWSSPASVRPAPGCGII